MTQEECPECKTTDIRKVESINGVDVAYLQTKQADNSFAWIHENTNWYGDTIVSYECNECGHEWQ